MDKLFKAVALAGMLCTVSCTHFNNRGTVERPFIESANTEFLSFTKVELTDSSTVLHAVVHYFPDYWISIPSSAAIIAGGDTLKIQSADGIELDKQFWMPDSGVTHFTLAFPPVPSDLKAIDFSTFEEEKGWTLYGIDLTGKPGKPSRFNEIPSELLSEEVATEWPGVVLDTDSVTVNIHLVGYRPEMGSDIKYFLYSMDGERIQGASLPLDSLGNATFKDVISGPSILWTTIVGEFRLFTDAILAPGETVEFWGDMTASGRRNMEIRGDSVPSRPKFYATGKYGPLKHALQLSDDGMYTLDIYSEGFADYHMSPEEYLDMILSRHAALQDSIKASDMSPVAKRMRQTELDASLIVAVSSASGIYRHDYRSKHGGRSASVPSDSAKIEFTDEQLRRVAGKVNLNNPDYLLLDNFGPRELADNGSMWNRAGADGRLLAELESYTAASEAAKSGKLTDEQLEGLRKLSTPFYAKAVETRRDRMAAVMRSEAAKLIVPTPDVAPDKLLEAIVTPHKGKVVVVDLWNTWCGPCRAAIKENEPLKDSELSSDDIVWIYIADDSSPIESYLEMIPDIRGIHYRLMPEQISAIRSHFGVDGIPYYILVSRDGKAQGRPDLRDHDRYKKAILDAVAKK